MNEAPGFIYIFTEATPDEIEALRSKKATPTFYKVGMAGWGSSKPSASIFKPVEIRQARAQSCNPRPINCLRVFAVDNEKTALSMEKTFHVQHQARHGVGLYKGHEWYRSTLSIAECANWIMHNGGRDLTSEYSVKTLSGAYEEGPHESSKKDSTTICPLIVYLLHLDDEGDWYRVLATGYDRKDVPRWYNTGNPREVKLHLKLAPKSGEAPEDRNKRVKSFMGTLVSEFGSMQSTYARKTRASWNTLAWVNSSQLPNRLKEIAIKSGVEVPSGI